MKKIILILTIALSCDTYRSSAQIYVTIQPPPPTYVRVASPGPGYVWIEEEWQPRGNTYVFVGGHWAAPPQPGRVWIQGRWSHGPRGHLWTPGRWQVAQPRGNGHYYNGHGKGPGKGHGKGHRK